MAQQQILLGSQANDRTGDPVRVAGDKINANFAELYAWARDVGRPLSYYAPNADRGGSTDTTDALMNAIGQSAADGIPLLVGAGDYLNTKKLDLVSNATIFWSPRARLLRGVSTTGVNGHISQADFGTPLTNIRWYGGQVCNLNPAGLAGNAISLNTTDSEFAGFFVNEWSSAGRAFINHGARNLIHSFRAVSVNDGGGIRIERNTDTIVSNGYVACGDDTCMFLVPATGAYAGGLTARCQFVNLTCYSWNARLAVAAMQRTSVEADIDGELLDCAYIGIRGRGRLGFACYNTLSIKKLARIRVIGCQFDCSVNSTNGTAIDIHADAAHGGIEDISLSDVDVLSPLERALYVRGVAKGVRVQRGFFGAPRTAGYRTIDVDDSAEATIEHSTIEARAGSDTIRIGFTAGSSPRAFLRHNEIRNIADSQDGIVVSNSAEMDIVGNRFLAAGGSTLARAFTVASGAQKVLVRRNNYDSIPIAAKIAWPSAANAGCLVDEQATLSISANTTTRAHLSGTTYILTGSTQRTLTLPPAGGGLSFRGVQSGTGALRIQAAAGDVIQCGTVTSTAGGYIQSSSVGATVEIVAIDDTNWIAVALSGTWTAA